MDTVSEPFDVLSFVEHTSYPASEVVVFQDAKSADAYVRAQEERNRSIEISDGESVLDKTIAELETKIRDSAIVFELQGLAPYKVQELLSSEAEDDETATLQTNTLIAETIKAVRNSKGVYDGTPMTPERVAAIRKNLKEGEVKKLVEAVTDINFNATLFDKAIDAGFPGRRVDVG